MNTAPRAIIADDEPHLRRHLIRLLQRLWPELEICAEASNGVEALATIATHAPDLVFLDIRMPVLDGLGVARALADPERNQPVPLIAFVTAYDEYAVKAFEAEATDYLLKPIAEDRLSIALTRIQSRLAERAQGAGAADADPAAHVLPSMLSALLDRFPTEQTKFLTWLTVGQGDTTELVQVSDVVYFRSDRKYTSAFTAEREYVLRLSLKELVEQLDPDAFWQIHRGLIVNVSEIVSAERDLRGRYTLKLRRRRETIRSSAAFGHLFKRM
ncbi:MAG: LytTR family DNA-binding domain-containing protein [Pseudomonadota bacterium]